MKRFVVVVLAGALLLPALAACNNKSTAVSAGVSASGSPEDLRASAAAVAKGLGQITTISATIAATAATDKTSAQASFAEIEPVWSSIEGTVKANDSSAYLSFEDSFAILEASAKSGDAIRAATASASVAATVKAYLAKYPG